jgi:ribonuclease HI
LQDLPGPIDGPTDISNSTRSELGGLVAPLLLCTSLAAFWGLRHRCRYRWATDSQAAISKVQFITRPSKRLSKAPEDVDYLTAIRELHKSLGGRLQTQWVKGHQDEKQSYDTLSYDAKLNVDADALATDHMNGSTNLPSQYIPHTPWMQVSIEINGQRYPSQIDAQMRFHINGSYLKRYLQERQCWSEATWNKIDMYSFGKFFRNLPPGKRVQHMKFAHDLQPTGMRKQVLSPHSKIPELATCPCCKIALETSFHIMHCPKNAARCTALTELLVNLRKIHGNQYGMVLADIIDQWMSQPAVSPSPIFCRNPKLHYTQFPSDYVDLIVQAIADQSEIGWLNLLRGYLAKSWCILASTYITSSKTSPLFRDDGQFRISRTLRFIHQFIIAVWRSRNEALHATAQANMHSIHNIVDSEIATLYNESAFLPAADQHYFNISLSTLLRSRPSYKRRWLYRVRASRSRLLREEANQPKITRFFVRVKLSDHIQKKSQTLAKRHQQLTDDDVRRRTRRRHQNDTQQILSKFLQERAPNIAAPTCTTKSPSPI